jgi:hypothetical protein
MYVSIVATSLPNSIQTICNGSVAMEIDSTCP